MDTSRYSWNVTELALLVAAVVAPGAFGWWTGRHLVRRQHDPALPERMLTRQQHAQMVMVLSAVLLVYTAGPSYWFAFAALLIGAWIGEYPSRRVVFDESWTLGAYLLWHARFTAGYVGFWFGLLVAPSLIHVAGTWRWPVAGALAVALGVWGACYAAAFLWLVRARPLALPAIWAPVLERSPAPRPRLLAMPVPGGRFANAFALPSSGVPSVLFTAPLLELLTPREQAAILAHEMAHLEHYDRRRCRLATAAGYTLVGLATLGAALALEWVSEGVLIIVWSAAIVIGLALRTSLHKQHETESDLRALALCQDADALISGLTKLTAAGRMPRRWSTEIERHASHPSLARRLQAIRHAAGIAGETPASTDPLVVSTARPDTRLVIDDRGVSWIRGTASWTVPYTELVELRVAASWWGGASLRLRDRAGTSRKVRIAAADVYPVQQRLDAVEDRLPRDPVPTVPSALVGRVTALGLLVVSIGTLLPLGFIVGLIGALRPSRASLAAVAGAAGACVLVVLGDLADGRHWTQAASASGAVLVAALAAWLAARPRTVAWRKADYLPVLIATGLIAAVAWGSVTAHLLSVQPAASRLMDTLASAPILWASLATIGCALMTAPRRTVQSGGVAVLVAAVLINLGVRIVDLDALSRVVAPPSAESRPLPRVATLALPTPGGVLRVSPLGSRVAVALRSAPHSAARRLLVLGATGERIEVEGYDLHFVDEISAIVVSQGADGTTLRHVRFAARSEAVDGWRVVVAGIKGVRLSSVHGGGWAGIGYDAMWEHGIGVRGRIGTGQVERQRLDDDHPNGIGGTVALAPDGRSVRVTTEPPSLGLSWAGLLYAGHQPRQSRVWRVDRDRRQYLIASLPAYPACHLVGRELATVVCVATERSRSLLWRFDAATAAAAPLIVPGRAWRPGVSRDGRWVGLWTGDEVLTVDLDIARAKRWILSPAAGYPIDVVPAGDRLITLTYSTSGATVDVYDARWNETLSARP